MPLLSTIIAFLAWWVLGWSMVGWGPLSTLIPSVWSLKDVGAWNHLSLWGDKSLSSWLRHLLRTLSDGMKDWSSRWRIDVDARLGVGALLGLTLLLALVWQYSFPILKHKSLVYHGLKVLKVSGFQSMSVTTGFKAKTRCSSYVCPRSSCHTYGQNVSTENKCLYYIISYYKNLLQVQKELNSRMDTILPQANDRGFHTPRRGLHQSTPHLLSSRA
jgi:hypothetical protein